MKILFIVSSLVSVIVIISLIIVNVVFNKESVEKNNKKPVDTTDITNTKTKDITKDTDITKIIKQNNTITVNKLNNTDNTKFNKIVNKHTLYKCQNPFYINEVHVYIDKNVNKIDIICQDNSKNIIELDVENKNITKKEFKNRLGFSTLNVYKDRLDKLLLIEFGNNNRITNKKKDVKEIKYICPKEFKISGILLSESISNLNFSIVCIK